MTELNNHFSLSKPVFLLIFSPSQEQFPFKLSDTESALVNRNKTPYSKMSQRISVQENSAGFFTLV